jgi:hypothetical protein
MRPPFWFLSMEDCCPRAREPRGSESCRKRLAFARLGRIEFVALDHFLAQIACFAEGSRRFRFVGVCRLA